MSKPNAPNQDVPEILDLTPQLAANEIAQRASAIASEAGRRVLIGIAGGPGVGKSTIAAAVTEILNQSQIDQAVLVPMDGFHMRRAKLKVLDFEADKGAPHTFEAEMFAKFLALLKRSTKPVAGPTYSRAIEDVVEDEFTVAADVPILIVEGNYLLLDGVHWQQARQMLDFSVFIDVPRDKVRARLLKRHAEHGLFSAERNIAHVDNVDLNNFDLVARSKVRADLIINLQTDT